MDLFFLVSVMSHFPRCKVQTTLSHRWIANQVVPIWCCKRQSSPTTGGQPPIPSAAFLPQHPFGLYIPVEELYTRTFQEVSINSTLEVKVSPKPPYWKVPAALGGFSRSGQTAKSRGIASVGHTVGGSKTAAFDHVEESWDFGFQ